MPGGRGKIRPEDNTNGFQKNPKNINRNGAQISIKNQLKELLLKEGELPLPVKQFVKMDIIDGKEYYIFKIPTQLALALKLVSMAMGKNNNAFQAIKLIQEMYDGRAKQEIDANMETTIKYQNVSKQFPDE